jgi:pimeloyl-ACP methyl ester carboxylesterase
VLLTRFADLGDATVAYEIVGSGPRLVWCHGLGSARSGDRDVIDGLAAHFMVLAYDARGHGDSPPVTDEARFTYTALEGDLRLLLEHVGWERAVLAGASMGAGTVSRLAMRSPALPVALIMARPGSAGTPAAERLQLLFRLGGEAIRQGGWEGAVEFLISIPEAAATFAQDPGRLDALRAEWTRHHPESIAAALIGIPPSAPLTPDLDPGAITAPTLVIPGNDPIHPLEAGRAVAAAIPGARLADPFDGVPRGEETRRLVALIVEFVAPYV